MRTIRSVLNSDYKNLHVIVIDDGSSDRTAEVAARGLCARRSPPAACRCSPSPTAARPPRSTTPSNGSTRSSTSASTPIRSSPPTPSPSSFPTSKTRAIGAVAGNAKVGNRVNLWTRWQALEYITSQNFERRALDLFNVVTVVPGAIGAWRTAPVKAAGGYPLNTVAEDADLTMNLLEQGCKVDLRRPRPGLHRSAHRRQGPDAPALPLVVRHPAGGLEASRRRSCATRPWACSRCPISSSSRCSCRWSRRSSTSCSLAGIVHYFIDRHYHPEAASAASFEKLLAYFLAFLLIDFVTSSVAFSLERRHPANKGDGWLLFHIWLQRFAYRQVFSIVLFKTLKRAIDGKPFNWDKIERTAKMSKQTEALTETPT